ncbi:MAG: DUF3717 domain-containing protein [Betaproteobacteria bacterium]|nr:DUF3717 domain-containing protein [Betaproteobacteria bacterium]NBP35361.1 DUF3717 domain-containing protein [Betaproteobacteria bacterium]NBQ94656.1 DUF3717 domain-containing protein [Betaproteobacteria bacterium]NBT71248.1 DUF3717 domain-containing protein [Betaproteobacteria bacterium]NCV15774.1 DUF3717 domain-containing protein [Betaproteobacteria bacterium]
MCNTAKISSKNSETGLKLMISLQQLEQAINRARASSPSRGTDAQLDPEVSVLAGIYGQMIYYRLKTLALSALSPRELEAWQRWSLPRVQQIQSPPYPEDRGSDKP